MLALWACWLGPTVCVNKVTTWNLLAEAKYVSVLLLPIVSAQSFYLGAVYFSLVCLLA